MNSIVKELKNIDDYVFPFEGERHLATIVMIPYRKDTWREDAVPAIKEYLNVVKNIARFEPVIVIADPRLNYKTVAKFELKNVHILRLRYDDAWARDMVPVFMKNEITRRLCGVDFGFNAWGGDFDGLYHPWDDDNNLGREVLLDLRIHRYAQKDFILEGGSIHTDGEGTLLVTEECLLSKGRNPSLSKEEIEAKLKETLHVEKVLWIPYGIYNDETDGHVDNICCFLKPGIVLLASCDDVEDPQYERSQKDLEYLESITDAKGRKLQIIQVPCPKPMFMSEEEASQLENGGDAVLREGGRRLAASYVNFYMGEKFILLPHFQVPEDDIALETLKNFYGEEKEIIPIDSREILLGGGNIHCITKQIPYMENYPIFPEDKDK